MSTDSEVPEPLQSQTVEARIIREKIWEACNVKNQHFMAAVVGREGSGKSYTSLKIAETADPSFNADRVMFDPQTFLERLREWKANNETRGKLVVADEAGVGVGVRTWYNKDQILFNQVLQVIRDENMGILFTLPRLSELDSQARGRLHAVLEMTSKRDGRWAKLKWLDWDPARDERNKNYRQYPKLTINGSLQQVKRLKITPPSEDLVREYSQRKDEFQDELYQDAIDEMDDSEEEKKSAKDWAAEIKEDEDELSKIISFHNGHHKYQLDKELIYAEYDVSHSTANTVKKLLANDDEVDVEAITAETEGAG